MSKRRDKPPGKDPAQQKLDDYLQKAHVVDLRNQAKQLNAMFDLASASKDARTAAMVSTELRRLDERIGESIFESGLVVSAGNLSDFATQFCDRVLALMMPWEQLVLILENLAIKLRRVPLKGLPDEDREFVSDVVTLAGSAEVAAGPIIDIQFLVADLLREVANKPTETYESLLRSWAKAQRLNPEK